MELTKEQVIDLLNNDVSFAVDFALWNNGSGIAALWPTVVGGQVPDYSDLKDYLVNGLQQRNEKVALLLDVPYINNVQNWTAGFDQYFQGNLNYMDPGNGYKSAWSGILQGIGAFFTSWGGSMNTNNSGQPQLTPQQQAALDEQKRKEEEEKRKQTITLVAIIGGAFILITTAIILTVTLGGKSKPKPKPAA